MRNVPNFWLASAAWWTLMVLLGAMFALPALSWSVVAHGSKVLITPALVLVVMGIVLRNPETYLCYMVSLGLFYGGPAAIVFMTPVASLVLAMGEKVTAKFYVLLAVALLGLSIMFLVLGVLRAIRLKMGLADSYVFIEDGRAYVRLSDLQGPHTSKGDSKFKIFALPGIGLAMLGYPLQKYLVLTSGSISVSFFLALLSTPIATWLIASMVHRFSVCVVPIWRYERTHGRPVYLRWPD